MNKTHAKPKMLKKMEFGLKRNRNFQISQTVDGVKYASRHRSSTNALDGTNPTYGRNQRTDNEVYTLTALVSHISHCQYP